MSETLFIGGSDDGNKQELLLRAANRHGLVAGATGTGKTVTLQILAQGFAEAEATKTKKREMMQTQNLRGALPPVNDDHQDKALVKRQ